jgi:predicted ATPase
VERLLEREAVLAKLAALTRAAEKGRGQAVLLRGEAGVGKTAVITRFTSALDGGMHVLRGWCDPLAAPRPLGPLLDALAGVGPAAARALDEAIESGDTGALYRRLLTVLRDGPSKNREISDPRALPASAHYDGEPPVGPVSAGGIHLACDRGAGM